MKSVSTDPVIRECIYHYLMEQGETDMIEVCDRMGYGVKYRNMAKVQEEIGWRQLLEGMICSDFRILQHAHYLACRLRKTGKWLAQQLIIKLLEITHAMNIPEHPSPQQGNRTASHHSEGGDSNGTRSSTGDRL